jgi:[ribosomal protein S5]-alanine N-acetyltransferase
VITTERLIIRPFLATDYHDLYDYLSLPEVYRFEHGKPMSLKEAKKECKQRAKGDFFWAAALKDGNKKLIGHLSFYQVEPKFFLTWEIGYIFSPAFQNHGYATEASRAIIRYAFTELRAHRVVGHCSPENTPSWKVLEKCGMQREGLARKNFLIRNDEHGSPVWLDSYQYAILEEDFRKQSPYV